MKICRRLDSGSTQGRGLEIIEIGENDCIRKPGNIVSVKHLKESLDSRKIY